MCSISGKMVCIIDISLCIVAFDFVAIVFDFVKHVFYCVVLVALQAGNGSFGDREGVEDACSKCGF